MEGRHSGAVAQALIATGGVRTWPLVLLTVNDSILQGKWRGQAGTRAPAGDACQVGIRPCAALLSDPGSLTAVT